MVNEQEDMRVASTINIRLKNVINQIIKVSDLKQIIQAEDNYLNGKLLNILDGATIGGSLCA